MKFSTALILISLICAAPAHAQDNSGILSADTSTDPSGSGLANMRDQLKEKRAKDQQDIDDVNAQLTKNQLDSLADQKTDASVDPGQNMSEAGTDALQPKIEYGASPDATFSFIAPDTTPGQANTAGSQSDPTLGGILAP